MPSALARVSRLSLGASARLGRAASVGGARALRTPASHFGLLTRRPPLAVAVIGGGGTFVSRAFAQAAGDGAWAERKAAFAEDDFAGWQDGGGGLLYKIVSEGTGDKPSAGKQIQAHYSGYLLSGKKFDSSYARGQPLGFAVGKGQVIAGWDKSLLDMCVGERRVIKIPPSMGYGARGAGGVTPPDATLVFYVELMG